MAIDPSIVFQQRQVPSPMDSAVKAQNLKNILLQNQSNRQLVDQNNLKLQQMKQEMEDEQTAKSIISKYGGDISQAQPELVQAMGGRALPVLENIAKTQKAIDGMDDARRKQAQDSLSMMSNMIDGVASLPPEQRQQAYQIKLSQLVQSGALPIERARSLPRQWDDSVSLLGDRMKQLNAEMDARSKRTTAEKTETELRGTKADTAEKEMKQKAREDFFAKNPNATLFDYMKAEAQAKQIPVAGRDVPLPQDVYNQQAQLRKMGRASSSTSNPEISEGLDELAKALASNDPDQLVRLKDVTSLRGDQRLIAYARAKKLNPNFSPAEADRKMKMLDWAYNGKGADQIQSYGTFLEHAGAVVDAMESVNLYSSPAFNKPMNWIRQNASGDPNLAALLTALDPVKKEFESFLLNNRALYSEDRAEVDKIISENSSPAQMLATLKQMGHTAKARANEINARYKKVVGKDIDDMFTPEAIHGAQKIGLKLANGNTANRTNSQNRMTATNPQTGAKIESIDGGKTWQPIQ